MYIKDYITEKITQIRKLEDEIAEIESKPIMKEFYGIKNSIESKNNILQKWYGDYLCEGNLSKDARNQKRKIEEERRELCKQLETMEWQDVDEWLDNYIKECRENAL